MKDLYTFDTTKEEALETYATVQHAYAAFFAEFNIANFMTDASSGEMGGDLSHEVHMPSEKGEDRIVMCDSCKWAANEEVAQRGLTIAQKWSQVSHEVNASVTSDTSAPSQKHPRNEEESPVEPDGMKGPPVPTYRSWTGLTSDRRTLVQAFYPPYVTQANPGGKDTSWEAHVDPHVLQSLLDDLDLGIVNPMQLWKESVAKYRGDPQNSPRILWIFDHRLPQDLIDNLRGTYPTVLQDSDPSFEFPATLPFGSVTHDPRTNEPLDIIKVKIENGDKCPKCERGSLQVLKSVEIGHTFYLGTRYSRPLEATVASDPTFAALFPSTPPAFIENSAERLSDPPGRTTLQMGCHGIGVSRLIAALADAKADAKGLNWPRVVAPFEVIVIPSEGLEQVGEHVYDMLVDAAGKDKAHQLDTILDDREKELAWKFNDADLIGYPVIVVLGRAWKKVGKCEVQCRQLGVKEEVELWDLRRFVGGLLERV